jgi:hypothetical protein
MHCLEPAPASSDAGAPDAPAVSAPAAAPSQPGPPATPVIGPAPGSEPAASAASSPAFANSVCVANVCTTRNVDDAGDAGATGPWDCLSQPSATTNPKRQVDVKLVTFDSLHPFTTGGNADGGDELTIISYTPRAGVAVAACTPDDFSCAAAQTSVVGGGLFP